MGYQWQNKTFLVVEDDDSSSFLIGEILKKTNAEIYFVSTGNEAVDYIKKHPQTDVVVMDIFLPDKDGLTTTKEIKAINSSIIVIAQSAYTHEVNIESCLKSGADDFLTKPLTPGLLLSRIAAFFE